jgi:hypothetical protein
MTLRLPGQSTQYDVRSWWAGTGRTAGVPTLLSRKAGAILDPSGRFLEGPIWRSASAVEPAEGSVLRELYPLGYGYGEHWRNGGMGG